MSDAANNDPRHREGGARFLDLANVFRTLTTLIDRLDSAAVAGTDVIPWGCPVPSFGDLSNSRVATLGLNPSRREFMDELGQELQGSYRRFHTLNSLGLESWSEVDARHLRRILETCYSYFFGNPYDAWFKRLDVIISGANASYYDESIGFGACHLDLIPYATEHKWTDLTIQQRSTLLDITSDTLALMLRDSPIRILVLNGKSVVDQFQVMANTWLNRQEMPEWSLPRQSPRDVVGVAYRGVVHELSGIELRHEVLVLGFNHNLQSSFGVTTEVIYAIRDWIAQVSKEVIQ